MKSSIVFVGGAGIAIVICALAGREAVSAGQAGTLVRLQAATPGTAQVGHVNINGTLIAGLLKGNGSSVTSVNADLFDGLNSTAFLQAVPNPLNLTGATAAAPVVSGTNTSTTNSSAGVQGESTAATGTTYGGYFSSASTNGVGVLGVSTAVSGTTYGGYFGCSNPGPLGMGVFATSQGAYGVRGQTLYTGGTSYGGYFTTPSTSGNGTYGLASAATGTTSGGYFEANSTSGRGVVGSALASTGTTFGGHFTNNSSGGRGVFGSVSSSTGSTYAGFFQTASTGGTGVYGFASATSGTTYGAWFESNSPSGYGVYATSEGGYGVRGDATAVSGNTYGGYFASSSTSGRGVFGLGSATGATDVPYGVRGQASTGTNGFAVYALGDLGASGVKPFRIDHPLDPEGKYLLHYSAESPFPQNFYCGNVTTDAAGKAWVELPDYFAEINTNLKYQVTVVEDSESSEFVQVKVARKVRGNRFLVMTSAPNIEVSWEVKADRNDLRIKANRPTDERLKNTEERGRYQHPEYYGLGPEMGMDSTETVQKRK